ncbi:hypothetical protein D3C80_1285070 [compost metagenome]
MGGVPTSSPLTIRLSWPMPQGASSPSTGTVKSSATGRRRSTRAMLGRLGLKGAPSSPCSLSALKFSPLTQSRSMGPLSVLPACLLASNWLTLWAMSSTFTCTNVTLYWRLSSCPAHSR